jgi:biopolymer transport protein ExbB/TolQ
MEPTKSAPELFDALWHGIWSDNTQPGRIIVLVIACLLVWALQASSRHLGRYRREQGNLDRLIKSLRKESEPQPPPEAGDAPEAKAASEETRVPHRVSPADLASLRQDLAQESLIAERLEAIEKLRTRQVKVSPSALQQLSLARDEARPGMAVAGAVAGLSTMLGLLGTFFGLAIMVQQVQFALPGTSAAVTASSWGQSVNNITHVLGGIKTAFSASLVGIVCAILASLLNFRLRTAQALFFERFERFTVEELLPAAVPTVEDESLLERVSLQLENSFGQLESIFFQNQNAIKDLTAAQHAFVEIVDEIRKMTRSEASLNLEGVLEQLALANRSVLSVVEHLPRIANAIEAGQRRVLDKLGSLFAANLPVAAVVGIEAKPRFSPILVTIIVAAVLAVAMLVLKRS